MREIWGGTHFSSRALTFLSSTRPASSGFGSTLHAFLATSLHTLFDSRFSVTTTQLLFQTPSPLRRGVGLAVAKCEMTELSVRYSQVPKSWHSECGRFEMKVRRLRLGTRAAFSSLGGTTLGDVKKIRFGMQLISCVGLPAVRLASGPRFALAHCDEDLWIEIQFLICAA
jgi:hypothetical protein